MILLDTHVVVWMASGDSRLSTSARTAIHEARKSMRGLAISDITLFEVSLLLRKKRFELTGDPEAFLSDIERRFVVLPITANIALQAFQLPASYPKKSSGPHHRRHRPGRRSTSGHGRPRHSEVARVSDHLVSWLTGTSLKTPCGLLSQPSKLPAAPLGRASHIVRTLLRRRRAAASLRCERESPALP